MTTAAFQCTTRHTAANVYLQVFTNYLHWRTINLWSWWIACKCQQSICCFGTLPSNQFLSMIMELPPQIQFKDGFTTLLQPVIHSPCHKIDCSISTHQTHLLKICRQFLDWENFKIILVLHTDKITVNAYWSQDGNHGTSHFLLMKH